MLSPGGSDASLREQEAMLKTLSGVNTALLTLDDSNSCATAPRSIQASTSGVPCTSASAPPPSSRAAAAS